MHMSTQHMLLFLSPATGCVWTIADRLNLPLTTSSSVFNTFGSQPRFPLIRESLMYKGLFQTVQIHPEGSSRSSETCSLCDLVCFPNHLSCRRLHWFDYTYSTCFFSMCMSCTENQVGGGRTVRVQVKFKHNLFQMSVRNMCVLALLVNQTSIKGSSLCCTWRHEYTTSDHLCLIPLTTQSKIFFFSLLFLGSSLLHFIRSLYGV